MKSYIIALLVLPSTLAAQDTNTGLLARFNLDGDVLDLSGNGNHGSLVGNFAYVADRFGNPSSALSFSDTTPPVTGTGINLSGSSMTIAFWFSKVFDPIDAWALGIGSISDTGQQAHIAIDYGGDIRFSFFYNDLDYTATPQQSTATWYHVAATYDADSRTRKIFVNGAEVASDIAIRGFSGTSNWGFGINGLTMDDVRIYNRALSSSDVSALTTIPEPSSFTMVLAAFSMGLTLIRRNRY